MNINSMGTSQLRAELEESIKREAELKGKLDLISSVINCGDVYTDEEAICTIDLILITDLYPSCHGKGEIDGFKCPDCEGE